MLNNGATGMPNFQGDRAGLLTRLAVSPFEGHERRFGMALAAGEVHVDAIGVEFDADAWLRRFGHQWPPGSYAHLSYFDRIAEGPAYGPREALREGLLALLAALVFVAVGPAVLAYRAWGIGVQRAGPTVASFFGNLTPLLAALMSAALLGELPQLYHGAAFVLIVGGIVVSSARR